MEQTLTFGDQCINKNQFHVYKKAVIFYGIYIKKKKYYQVKIHLIIKEIINNKSV